MSRGPYRFVGSRKIASSPYCCAVRLSPDENGLLRDAVRRVRLFRVAVPELVLAERDGSELRVGADRPDDDELRRRVDPRLLENIGAHREVREPVAAGIRAVRADAPNLGREVEHELGLGIAEHAGGVVHRGEVVVGAAGDDDLVTVGLEALDEVRSEESSAAGDEGASRRGYKRTAATGQGFASRCEAGYARSVTDEDEPSEPVSARGGDARIARDPRSPRSRGRPECLHIPVDRGLRRAGVHSRTPTSSSTHGVSAGRHRRLPHAARLPRARGARDPARAGARPRAIPPTSGSSSARFPSSRPA